MLSKQIIIEESEVKTQTDAVKWHLLNKGTITSWEAIKEYGATRLGAIIFNLRREGYDITSTPLKLRNRFGRVTVIAKYHYAQYEKVNKSKGEQQKIEF